MKGVSDEGEPRRKTNKYNETKKEKRKVKSEKRDDDDDTNNNNNDHNASISPLPQVIRTAGPPVAFPACLQ